MKYIITLALFCSLLPVAQAAPLQGETIVVIFSLHEPDGSRITTGTPVETISKDGAAAVACTNNAALRADGFTWSMTLTTTESLADHMGVVIDHADAVTPAICNIYPSDPSLYASLGSPLSVDVVGKSYTWFAERYRATNIIEVEDTFAGTLAMKPDLNPGVTISTVDTVTITGAATVTATTLTVDRTRTKAHFSVPSLTTVGTYTVKVKVTTVEGDVISTTGTMKVY